METDTNAQAVVEVPPASHAGSPGLTDVSTPMVLLTWITFLILVLLLSRLAWRPILNALDLREKSIRRALDEAEKARADAAATELRNRESLQAAADEARRMIEEALRLLADAHRDIEAAVAEARLALRRETSALALELAGKVLERNVDSAANRELVKSLAQELDRL